MSFASRTHASGGYSIRTSRGSNLRGGLPKHSASPSRSRRNGGSSLTCRFAAAAHTQGRRVLLIVDEAHTLNPDALKKVHALIARDGDGDDHDAAPCVLLVGQTELRTNLSLQGLAPDATCHLWPLTLEQSEQYIDHRLHVAGSGSPLFTPTAV